MLFSLESYHHLESFLKSLILVYFKIFFLMDDCIIEIHLEFLKLILWIHFMKEIQMPFALLGDLVFFLQSFLKNIGFLKYFTFNQLVN